MDTKPSPAIGPVFAAVGMAICGICHLLYVAADWRVLAFFLIAALFSIQALIRWKRDQGPQGQ
ncbi:MAG: hypothetical protein E7812_03915 [Phenylobacterium sp.]|nr:MAG: hypothetical protein E7812_03915 [Phenylobacterium sp.]